MTDRFTNTDGTEKNVDQLRSDAKQIVAATKQSIYDSVPIDGDWVNYRSEVETAAAQMSYNVDQLQTIEQFIQLYDGKLDFTLIDFPTTPVDEQY